MLLVVALLLWTSERHMCLLAHSSFISLTLSLIYTAHDADSIAWMMMILIVTTACIQRRRMRCARAQCPCRVLSSSVPVSPPPLCIGLGRL